MAAVVAVSVQSGRQRLVVGESVSVLLFGVGLDLLPVVVGKRVT